MLHSRVVEVAADQALRIENGVCGVVHGLGLGSRTDEARLAFTESDIGRGRSGTLGVVDDVHIAISPVAHTREGRAQVNANGQTLDFLSAHDQRCERERGHGRVGCFNKVKNLQVTQFPTIESSARKNENEKETQKTNNETTSQPKFGTPKRRFCAYIPPSWDHTGTQRSAVCTEAACHALALADASVPRRKLTCGRPPSAQGLPANNEW